MDHATAWISTPELRAAGRHYVLHWRSAIDWQIFESEIQDWDRKHLRMVEDTHRKDDHDPDNDFGGSHGSRSKSKSVKFSGSTESTGTQASSWQAYGRGKYRAQGQEHQMGAVKSRPGNPSSKLRDLARDHDSTLPKISGSKRTPENKAQRTSNQMRTASRRGQEPSRQAIHSMRPRCEDRKAKSSGGHLESPRDPSDILPEMSRLRVARPGSRKGGLVETQHGRGPR